MNTDKYFFITWEDTETNTYRIGVLARINETYYLKTYKKKKNNERDAYSHGYDGLPGFVSGQLYKSTNQLFDYFLNRVFVDINNAKEVDYLEELEKTKGKMQTDSFSIEEIPEKHREKFKNIILAIDSEINKKKKKFLDIIDKC